MSLNVVQSNSTTHLFLCKTRIQSSRSTSSDRFILLVMVEKMRRFCLRSGRGNSIFLSRRPGRNRAGSSVSALLVAIITYSKVNREYIDHDAQMFHGIQCFIMIHCRDKLKEVEGSLRHSVCILEYFTAVFILNKNILAILTSSPGNYR